MKDLMLLCRCLPDPSGTGDSVRAWRMLRHLAGRYRVHLGCFGGGPSAVRAEGFVRQFCHGMYVVQGDPPPPRPSTGGGLFGAGRTARAVCDEGLQAWAERLWLDNPPALAVAVSAGMAPYALMRPETKAKRILDRTDIAEGPWSDPDRQAQTLRRWLLTREVRGLLLLDSSRNPAWDATLVGSPKLAERLRALVPEVAERIHAVPDGVDTVRFAPPRMHAAAEKAAGGPVIVLAGGIAGPDTIDGALWFAAEVLPRIRAAVPGCRLVLTTTDPKLQGAWPEGRGGVSVAAGVTDQRPWLAQAAVVVAPFRSPRPRAVLEAMAMARPVVASTDVLGDLDGQAGRDLWLADGADEFAQAVLTAFQPALASAVGRAARTHVVDNHSWEARLAGLDAVLDGQPAPAPQSKRSLPLG